MAKCVTSRRNVEQSSGGIDSPSRHLQTLDELLDLPDLDIAVRAGFLVRHGELSLRQAGRRRENKENSPKPTG